MKSPSEQSLPTLNNGALSLHLERSISTEALSQDVTTPEAAAHAGHYVLPKARVLAGRGMSVESSYSSPKKLRLIGHLFFT